MLDKREPQRPPGNWRPPTLVPVPPDVLHRVRDALARDREHDPRGCETEHD